MTQLKQCAWRAIADAEPELHDVALGILREPETGYCERLASQLLVELMARAGIHTQCPYGNLPTAFMGKTGAGQPVVAFCAEYDALPGIGHGCGHNLIGPAAVGAAVGVAAVLQQLKGQICVIGTPAEEVLDRPSGKVALLAAGAFEGVDVALAMHPYRETVIIDGDNGIITGEFVFTGRPAHAGDDPWNGANALDGIVATFNNLSALRQQLRPEVRLHGIITDGGQAPNIIPERAAATIVARAPSPRLLEQTWQRVVNCAQGAALATGTKLDVDGAVRLLSTRANQTLNALITANLQALGAQFDATPRHLGGSTDFGNVSHRLPAAWFMLKTHPDDVVWHSEDVAAGAGTRSALEGVTLGAKVLAGVAIDLLAVPELLLQARADFGQQ